MRKLLSITLTKTIFFTTFISVVQYGISQRRSDDYNSVNALDIYSDVAESGVQDPDLINKLASTNYLNGKFDEAAKWYDRYYAIPRNRPKMIDNYRYGQVLKTQKRYKEADSLLMTYYDYKGIRYNRLTQSKDNSQKLDNEGVFKIVSYKWNTDESEYPAFVKDNQLYVVGKNLDGVEKNSRKSTSNIYSVDLPTGKHTPLSEYINTPFNEGSAVLSNDGKTLYFSRNDYHKGRVGISKSDVVTINLYMASFRGGEWKNVKPFPFNNEEYSVGHPALSADNKTLYFISDKPGGKGNTDLYEVSIFEDGTFGVPKNMIELNTPDREMFPFIDKWDGSLYFSSDRPESLGGLDVFISKPNNDGIYKRSYNLGNEINSNYDDFSFMVTKNGDGYFASNRENDVREDDIFAFKVLRDFKTPDFKEIKGVLTDYNSNEPISGAKILLYDKQGNLLATTTTLADGSYDLGEFDMNKVGYVRIERDGYQAIEKNVDADLLKGNRSLISKMVKVGEVIPEKAGVKSSIKDKYTGKPIENATVTLLDINDEPILVTKSDQYGSFTFKDAPTDRAAFVKIEKEGYLSEGQEVDFRSIKDGWLYLDVNNLIRSDVPLEFGNDLASILNTIYFDFAKSDIRSDAQVELEKIVHVLKKFPSVEIQIESHTDSRGRDITNQRLSQLRAKSTYNYIISRGVNPKRLSYKGYGESRLLNKCRNGIDCSEEDHELNRRSSFTIK